MRTARTRSTLARLQGLVQEVKEVIGLFQVDVNDAEILDEKNDLLEGLAALPFEVSINGRHLKTKDRHIPGHVVVHIGDRLQDETYPSLFLLLMKLLPGLLIQ